MIPSSSLVDAIRRTILFAAVVVVTGCSSPADKAQNYYEQGMKLLSQQDYVKASIQFKNAIQFKKDLVGAWRGLLQIELHDNNVQAAVPILQTIVELDPKDVDAKIKLGQFLLIGNADQALDQANAAIALADSNPNALALRAAALLRLKDGVAAKRDAQRALDLDPKNEKALVVLAAESIARGDAEGALQVLDRPGFENDLTVQMMKIYVFEKSKNVKQIEPLLRKLVDLYPSETGFKRGLIKLYISQARFEDAEKEVRALSAANPSNIEAGLDVVRFLQQVKGPAVARQELVERINAGGQTFKYQLVLAEFDLAEGKVEDSIRLLENLVQKAPSSDDALAAQIKLAAIRFDQKKFDEADALNNSVLRKDKRNLEGLKLKALLFMERRQLDSAIAELRQALDDQPRQTALMLILATAYERSGAIELADKQYADAIRISNFDASVTLSYDRFLRRRGNIERSEDILIESARRRPNDIVLLSALADVRLARQNWTGAEEIAESIRRLGKEQVISEQIRGMSLFGQGKYEASIGLLAGVQATAPNAVQPLATLVRSLVRAEKLDQAVIVLQKALNANPANAEAHVLLGSVQLLKNAPDQAVRSFRTAIEQQPKNMAGYQALADYYVSNKNFTEAEKIVRAGLQEQSGSFSIQLTLAGILELKGDHAAAIAEYEALLAQQPGSMIASNNLASLLSDHRTDKASLERAYSLAAVLRKSENPSFKDTLGWIDYLRGEYKSAMVLLEDATAAMPDRPLVRYHLGMTYLAVGQIGKASDQFKKALEFGPDEPLKEKIKAAQKRAAM